MTTCIFSKILENLSRVLILMSDDIKLFFYQIYQFYRHSPEGIYIKYNYMYYIYLLLRY